MQNAKANRNVSRMNRKTSASRRYWLDRGLPSQWRRKVRLESDQRETPAGFRDDEETGKPNSRKAVPKGVTYSQPDTTIPTAVGISMEHPNWVQISAIKDAYGSTA
jgi:hypothetical protein